MNMSKSNEQSSATMSLVNFFGISLLASLGVSIALIGIVLLLSSVS